HSDVFFSRLLNPRGAIFPRDCRARIQLCLLCVWLTSRLRLYGMTLRPFNLTHRALAFAKIRAEHPGYSVKKCAELAGYSTAGAAVRGFELLRNERVVRAILHFSALAIAKAAGELSERMEASCKPNPSRCICGARAPASFSAGRWRVFDRLAIDRLRGETRALGQRLAKIEKLYEKTPWRPH